MNLIFNLRSKRTEKYRTIFNFSFLSLNYKIFQLTKIVVNCYTNATDFIDNFKYN